MNSASPSSVAPLLAWSVVSMTMARYSMPSWTNLKTMVSRAPATSPRYVPFSIRSSPGAAKAKPKGWLMYARQTDCADAFITTSAPARVARAARRIVFPLNGLSTAATTYHENGYMIAPGEVAYVESLGEISQGGTHERESRQPCCHRSRRFHRICVRASFLHHVR